MPLQMLIESKGSLAAESSGQITLNRLLKNSARAKPDVWAIATRGSHEVNVMLWNHDDDADLAPPARISLQIDGLPRQALSLVHIEWQAPGATIHGRR